MDLRTAFPRSMKTRLAGYVHLARMIDKYGEEIFRELEEEKQNKEEKIA